MALVLAKQGYKVDVYEKREKIVTSPGLGLQMHVSFRGARALREVGIDAHTYPQFGVIKSVFLYGFEGDPAAELKYQDDAYCFSIDRQDYYDMLHEEAGKDKNI